ncbi:MAG: aerotolerance regulator BatA, partial [Bacteroidaceae bacterium]|nr:aerotolerance regulator BatA [Bacteroidaceae bacterium]
IYTIGFRTDKEIVETPYGLLNNSEFDEKTLQSIASVTGGEYFRSSSKSSLIDIYDEIDKLERTKLEIKHFGDQEERFMIFAFIAIVSLALEILLRNTVLKTIP